jgi:hypothetical protein
VWKCWKFVLCTSAAWHVAAAVAAGPVELTEKAYAAEGQQKGTILLQVNWGRTWHCGKYENAQLQLLVFSKLPLEASETSTLPFRYSLMKKAVSAWIDNNIKGREVVYYLERDGK